MVTDLDEIYRLGTAKAKENLAFRRYLSAHHCSDKPFQILASSIQTQIDCTKCANCCRHSTVSISRLDLNNIASHLGISAEEAARRYTEPDPDAPALRTLRTSAQGCIFLDRNRCTIYEARPKACREFPHVSVGSHSLGSRASSHDRWAAYCPIIFNAVESYKHVTGFRAPS